MVYIYRMLNIYIYIYIFSRNPWVDYHNYKLFSWVIDNIHIDFSGDNISAWIFVIYHRPEMFLPILLNIIPRGRSEIVAIYPHLWYLYDNHQLVGGVPTPLKNMSSSVGMILPYIWKNNQHVPNRQPDIHENHPIGQWTFWVVSPELIINQPTLIKQMVLFRNWPSRYGAGQIGHPKWPVCVWNHLLRPFIKTAPGS